MRYPVLSDASVVLRWAQRLTIQLERDFNQLYGSKGSFSLSFGTTTTINDPVMRSESVVLLTPRTQSAAAVNWYMPTKSDGSFVISHPTISVSDVTYDYLIKV